jgi:hypothetical protein
MIASTREIEARINSIGLEIDELSADSTGFVLKRNCGQLQRAYHERVAELSREIAELRSRLPKTGEASGQHLVFARTLGTVYVRASEPEPPPDDGYDPSDPWQRYEREVGITR